MFTRSTLALSALVAVSVVAGAPALAADAASDDGPKGTYIVQFTPGANNDAEVAKAKSDGATVKHQYRKAINGMAVELSPGQLKKLQSDPNVALIEPDAVVTASATQSPATWGIDRTDQRSLPLDGAYTYMTTASNVTAYVIDTGVLTNHSELAGRVDASAGFTAYSDTIGTSDCDGHGTHVAGTIGGTNYGLAKGIRIVPVRVLGCNGSGSSSGLLAGIEHVILKHLPGEPAVANMSLGFGTVVTSVDTAVANLVADGVSVAVAAGNSNADACFDTPARVPTAITVGATTSSDARSSFSNYGSCLDIFAPGSEITSAWYSSTTATNTISGTSMASPHVAGAAALYLAANPAATPAQVASALVANSTANKVTGAGTGSANRLLYVTGSPVAPPAAPAITSISPNTARVGAIVTVAGTDLSGASLVTFAGATAVPSGSSATSVTVTVPAGAQTGAVTVTTPGGTSGSVVFTLDTTALPAPPPAPASLATSNITRVSATARWVAPSASTPIDGYEVKLSTSTTWTKVSSTSATLSGLRRNTLYTWQVRAVSGSVSGAIAQTTFRTAR